jgi:hypothetical protein
MYNTAKAIPDFKAVGCEKQFKEISAANLLA